MEKESTISWTRPMLERFKLAYKQAANQEVFAFEGYEFVPGYAKYLIEYLETRLPS